jgi:hypothetical protein
MTGITWKIGGHEAFASVVDDATAGTIIATIAPLSREIVSPHA